MHPIGEAGLSCRGLRQTENEMMIHHGRFATRLASEADVIECMKLFYNRQQMQKKLGYCSQAAFEKNTRAENEKMVEPYRKSILNRSRKFLAYHSAWLDVCS
jgi:hypothetical protein